MKPLFLILSTILVMQTHAQTNPTAGQQSNYHFSHTDSTTASPAKIWAVWTDVPNWKQWDKGLKEATLAGEFKVGSRGRLIPDKGPKSRFLISALEPGRSYTFKTKIPFGWLVVQRRMEVKQGRTFFTHEVEFTGLLKKLFGKKLGKNYRAMLPQVMEAIRKIAENK